MLVVDYQKEFSALYVCGDSVLQMIGFILGYFENKLAITVICFFNVVTVNTILWLMVDRLQQQVYQVYSSNTINCSILVELILILFVCSRLGEVFHTFTLNSFSCQLIGWACVLQHLIAKFMLKGSHYFYKFHFYSMIGAFINHSYMVTYPYANVTLTNIVFVLFALYQISHNLFKFSLQLEMFCIDLNPTTLAITLPFHIQYTLR
jgi:hypothetical protein